MVGECWVTRLYRGLSLTISFEDFLKPFMFQVERVHSDGSGSVGRFEVQTGPVRCWGRGGGGAGGAGGRGVWASAAGCSEGLAGAGDRGGGMGGSSPGRAAWKKARMEACPSSLLRGALGFLGGLRAACEFGSRAAQSLFAVRASLSCPSSWAGAVPSGV